ncbi:hypothetical protein Tco_0982070 [Tanacetum coccineum]
MLLCLVLQSLHTVLSHLGPSSLCLLHGDVIVPGRHSPQGRHADFCWNNCYRSMISENRVSPLLDLIMVRYRTCGISSIQSLLPLSNRAFIPSPKLLFALSTKPLACGCLTEAKHWRIFIFSPNP